jgi:hypothetical protein
MPSSRSIGLAVAALFLRATSQAALFVIGAAALSLLLLAIHNAWDAVTHIVAAGPHSDATKKE